MTKTSRLVVVCALSVLALRCSTNESGLGTKYDASVGGARDAAADRPVQSGGTIATGGGVGTGGMVASGGVTGTGGRGGTTSTGGRTGTGGTTSTGGRTGTGGAPGTGGTRRNDAGPECPGPDAGSGCCYTDEHCGNGQECLAGACNATSQPGVCKSTAGLATGQCWRDSDCPSATGTCRGVGVCPCGSLCLVADKLGTCQ
jgi:hypothetical protein